MEIALVVIGVLVVLILLMWIYASMNDPEYIDEEELADVTQESPEERAAAFRREKAQEEGQKIIDTEMHSHDPHDTDTGRAS